MRSIEMDVSTDNEALGLFRGSRAIPYIKELMVGKKMIIRFTPYNESSVQLPFVIEGLFVQKFLQSDMGLLPS